MKLLSSLLLLFLGVYVAGFSKAVEENNGGTSSMKSAENVLVNSEVNSRNTSSQPIESSSPSRRDIVFFDGKNYIKKNGWKKPPKKDTYKDETYSQGEMSELELATKQGKRVKAKRDLYYIRPLWWHSQDFIYKGQELDYLKGKLRAGFFTEISVNSKVFLYNITVEKVVSGIPPDGDHREPFVYEIMDSDGDGIFETLVQDDENSIVPNWVL